MKTERQTPAWWRWISTRAPHTYAITFWLLSLILFWQPLRSLAILSFHDELANHVLLIPVISALLIYLERKRIFCTPRYCPTIGVPLLLLSVALWYGLKTPLSHLSNTDRLSVVAALIVLTWIAAFVLFYGIGSSRAAAFPLLFLFLMSPLPVVVSAHLISLLQKGSADTCVALFRLIGVPVIRHGFRFSLPGVTIEVAEQCSGIHAGLSLFIAGLLAEHVLLQDTWKKACFTLCIFPIAIFKNAVRIVTIAWLGIHVNPAFFEGRLHRQGGLPFALVALALMALLLWLLRRPFPLFRTNPFVPTTGL
ncbi:MAG: exosortase/archaeosortase family protein [Terriglobia bacterium]